MLRWHKTEMDPGRSGDGTVLAGPRPRPFPAKVFGGLPWKRIALGTLLVLVLVAAVPPLRRAAALGASKALLIVLTPLSPSIEDFKNLPQGSKILAADGSVLADLEGEKRREQVQLKALPEHVPNAVLAAEDANFYDHAGVDPSAVFRALLRTSQGDEQGGSTITQQLAKLNYTGGQRTLLRKLREVQYAARLENKYTKDELLERYLNQVYFGDGAYGLAAAAQTFFSVPAPQLTPAQAAMLAGKIRSPEGLDPARSPENLTKRRDGVLRRMGELGWLDDKQLSDALATPLEVQSPPPPPLARAPHFVELVKREAAGIESLGGSAASRSQQLFTGGYTVQTTLDPAAFEAASRAVLSTLGGPRDPEVAIATVQPGDGAVRMLFGGRDFQGNKFDLASQGRRQPGSSIKPLVYLSALGEGIDPRSTFDASSPKVLDYQGQRFTVDNYEGQGTGSSTIDNALTHSINTVFAQLTLQVGPAKVMRTAESLGVDDVAENVGSQPAVGLGGLRRGLTPLEQAAAFATFAARGQYAEPYSIVAIIDRQGEEVYRRDPETRRAFGANETGVLNAALMSVVRDGTGQAADIGRPVAGKTGTTQNHGDAWFVGFVPQLSTAVWVGHPQEVIPMLNVRGRRVSGGSFPAQIWGDYMKAAVANLPLQDIFVSTPESLSLQLLNPLPPPMPPPPPAPPPPPTSTTLPPPTTTLPPTTRPPQTIPPTSTTTSTSSTTTTKPNQN